MSNPTTHNKELIGEVADAVMDQLFGNNKRVSNLSQQRTGKKMKHDKQCQEWSKKYPEWSKKYPEWSKKYPEWSKKYQEWSKKCRCKK